MSSISSTGGNLAAELTLNKIMNGQLQTESGRTVNSASRANAANFTLEAAQLTAITPGIKEASTNLTAYQSDVTAFKSQLLGALDNLSGASLTDAKALATNLQALYTEFIGKELYKEQPDAASEINVNIGNGQKMQIGDFQTTYDTEIAAINTALGLFASATDATLSTVKDGFAAALSDGGLDALTSIEGTLSGQIGILDERAVLIDDLTNTYNSGTANQYVQSATGATTLLNNVIG